MRGQRDITNLERHLDSLVSLYSVSTLSESSDTDIEPEAEPQVTNVPETPPENAPVSRESRQNNHISTAEEFNRWSPTSSETELDSDDCLVISETDSDI